MDQSKSFNWHKLGRILKVEGNYEWMNSHTTPISAVLLDNCIRIFFCTRSKIDRNQNFISYTGFLDLDINDPTKIIYIHNRPILELGAFGAFDEFGIMVTDVVKVNGKIYLYYAGWQRLGGNTAPYQVMLGLAISLIDNATFTKISNGPIMSIDYYDPISIGNVAVIKDDINWKMYYTSLTEWYLHGNKPTYEYVIKFAHSDNGIFWEKEGKIIIGIQNGYGVATPSVIKLDNEYHMWFGYRKAYEEDYTIGKYYIGYAHSIDGINWNRKDDLSGLKISDTGWDSEMVCYPCLLKTENCILMFYCGNDFGKEGFGVAELL